jgi:periplasmic protein TonB
LSFYLNTNLFLFFVVLIGIALYFYYSYSKSKALALSFGSTRRTKTVNADHYRIIGRHLLVGVSVTSFLILLLFNWTFFHRVEDDLEDFILNEEINIIPPRTSAEPPPPPAPEQVEIPVVQPETPVVTPEVIKPIEKPVEKPIEQPKPVVPQEVTSNNSTNVDSKSTDEKGKSTTTNTLGEEAVLMRAEQMPRFPGCESYPEDEKIKQACSKEKLKEYIIKNFNYPTEARTNKIEDVVYVKFVVDKDGSVSNISLIKDPGYGLGDAAKKIVENMNRMPKRWQPAMQNGQPVRVYYTLPVAFRLNKTNTIMKQ